MSGDPYNEPNVNLKQSWMKQCLRRKRQQYKGVGAKSECHSDNPKFSSVCSAELKAITAITHLLWIDSHNLSVTKKQMSNHLNISSTYQEWQYQIPSKYRFCYHRIQFLCLPNPSYIYTHNIYKCTYMCINIYTNIYSDILLITELFELSLPIFFYSHHYY